MIYVFLSHHPYTNNIKHRNHKQLIKSSIFSIRHRRSAQISRWCLRRYALRVEFKRVHFRHHRAWSQNSRCGAECFLTPLQRACRLQIFGTLYPHRTATAHITHIRTPACASGWLTAAAALRKTRERRTHPRHNIFQFASALAGPLSHAQRDHRTHTHYTTTCAYV